MQSIFQQLIKDHHKYYESSVNKRRFKYEEVVGLITRLKDHQRFNVEIVGKSFQGRDLFHVQWGNGPMNILMWSQMHGDESTATRAIFDIWNFLMSSISSENDDYKELIEDISEKISLHFIPILNPDGTNHWQRRTLQGIDMNRDALRLQTPEALVLKTMCDQIQPLFGFNLHDQSIYYSAGDNNKPATISFLSPAYNKNKEVNEVRERSMKLIAYLNSHLQSLIPGHIGKYDDTFNTRAFGDNIQKWGISTLLIESGGYTEDPEKEYIRKINFGLILEAVVAIANSTYEEVNIEEYESIPFNQKEHFFDLIIRNAVIKRNGREYKVDIGINRDEVDYNLHRDFYYSSRIADIGDLSTFHGYEEIDLNGMELEMGKVYPYIFETHEEALNYDFHKVLANGYTSIVVEDALLSEQFTSLPVNIQLEDDEEEKEIMMEDFVNLVAREEGQVKLTVVNGFIFKPDDENLGIRNGIVRPA